ncbi:hypothetical protein NDU88_004374 [Pleurodeles waltl]|uniref:Uncharacterized protein n=1 Tax=Pleurodeles waltl TaxID=8319 RepID=A0AAV7T7Y1_PLEWA|nr:hypothetical protein NDU88_004374 [Pleurodeles waltl]
MEATLAAALFDPEHLTAEGASYGGLVGEGRECGRTQPSESPDQLSLNFCLNSVVPLTEVLVTGNPFVRHAHRAFYDGGFRTQTLDADFRMRRFDVGELCLQMMRPVVDKIVARGLQMPTRVTVYIDDLA